MKYISKLLLILCCGGFVLPAIAGETDPLFISLTSDDFHRANMAISFGSNQYKLGHPLTIFLNDKGVMIASKSNSERFSELQKMLVSLVDNKAVILVCPMCMKHYGVKESDLLPGLRVGNPKLTGPQLFKDNTKTLVW